MGQDFSAEIPTPEDAMRRARDARNEQMHGTLTGAQFQLLDDIMDQIVLEDERGELTDALRRQLLTETQHVIRAKDSRYIYLTIRMPEQLRAGLIATGYEVWWQRYPPPPYYAVFLPNAENETRGDALQHMGYAKWQR